MSDLETCHLCGGTGWVEDCVRLAEYDRNRLAGAVHVTSRMAMACYCEAGKRELIERWSGFEKAIGEAWGELLSEKVQAALFYGEKVG